MTIAQRLGIKNFPFIVRKNGKLLYQESSDGFWERYRYNKNNQHIRHEISSGLCTKLKYNDLGQLIRLDTNDGFWFIKEYDLNRKEVYFENSNGVIRNNRPKNEYTKAEIAKIIGIPVEQLKIID